MSVEILLLSVMVGITLIGYMVAINAHGPTRLSLSYLIATVMLAGTVWLIVQHVNTGLNVEQTAQLRRLEQEKQVAEERIKSQEMALMENKERMGFAGKLNTVISQSTGLASTMINIDLQDRSFELDVLLARAADMVKKTAEQKELFERIKSTDSFFNEPMSIMKNGIQLLNEAAYYYRSYYYSEDSAQESLRERIMRQKARSAYEEFQKASGLIASTH